MNSYKIKKLGDGWYIFRRTDYGTLRQQHEFPFASEQAAKQHMDLRG